MAAPPAQQPSVETLLHRAVLEYMVAQCMHEMLETGEVAGRWTQLVEIYRHFYNKTGDHDPTVHMRMQFAKIVLFANDFLFADAAAALQQMVDRSGLAPTELHVDLVLTMRVQAVVRDADDPTAFMLAINRNFQMPTVHGGSALEQAITPHIRRMQKQLTACLEAREDDTTAVNRRRLGAVEHNYSYERLSSLLRMFITETNKQLPRTLLEQMVERELTIPFKVPKAGSSAMREGQPAPNAIPLSALRRIAPSKETWERIINETDPHVSNFLQGAIPNSTGRTPISAPVLPTRSSGGITERPLRIGRNTRARPEINDETQDLAAPVSEAVHQAVTELKISSKKLTEAVNDPLQELIQADGLVHIPGITPRWETTYYDSLDGDGKLLSSSPVRPKSYGGHRKRKILESFSDDEMDLWSDDEPNGSSAAMAASKAASRRVQLLESDTNEQDHLENDIDVTNVSDDDLELARLPDVPIHPFSIVHADILSATMKKSSKRQAWTEEEELNLAKGLREYGTVKNKWNKIHAAFKFNNRSPGDLKDKARLTRFRQKHGFL